MEMDGGATLGYWATGNWLMAMTPTSTISKEMTQANIGRSIKNLDIIFLLYSDLAERNCFYRRPGLDLLQSFNDHGVSGLKPIRYCPFIFDR